MRNPLTLEQLSATLQTITVYLPRHLGEIDRDSYRITVHSYDVHEYSVLAVCRYSNINVTIIWSLGESHANVKIGNDYISQSELFERGSIFMNTELIIATAKKEYAASLEAAKVRAMAAPVRTKPKTKRKQ